MKERPIIFNNEMVQAILKGRKTQTRRPIKIQPSNPDNAKLATLCSTTCRDERSHVGKHRWNCSNDMLNDDETYFTNPFGVAGDRLWVREAFFPQDYEGITDAYALYMADNPEHHEGPWKPSIHMPRWASRITLEIVDIRVERIQKISRDDVRAEGVGLPVSAGDTVFYDGASELHSQFAGLWDSIYKKKGLSWKKNPWVWAVEFKRV